MLTTVACSSGTSSTATAVSSASVATTSAAAVATTVPTAPSGPARLAASDVQALIDGALAAESWASSVVGLSDAVVLRRPVVRIMISDQDAAFAAFSTLQTALQSSPVTDERWGVLEVSGPSFTSFAPLGLTWFEPVVLPPPPASGELFAGWLDQAFGASSSAPEDWVAHVKSTGFAASLPSGGSNVLTVQTDLAFDADGHRIAAEIFEAILAAAYPGATHFAVYFGDGNNEYSGEIVPASGAFGYQT